MYKMAYINVHVHHIHVHTHTYTHAHTHAHIQMLFAAVISVTDSEGLVFSITFMAVQNMASTSFLKNTLVTSCYVYTN